MIKLLRGIDAPGWLVGIALGAREAARFSGVLYALDAMNAADAPDWTRIAGPLAALFWRSIEGTVDHIDPAKKRGN